MQNKLTIVWGDENVPQPITPQGVVMLQNIIQANMPVLGLEIEIHLCSGGGDHIAAQDAYGYLRALTTNGAIVTTHARGKTASAAATIHLAGENRSMEPSAMIGIHAVANGLGDVTPCGLVMADLYHYRIGLPLEAAQMIFSDINMTWCNATESHDHGLITSQAVAIPLPQISTGPTLAVGQAPVVYHINR